MVNGYSLSGQGRFLETHDLGRRSPDPLQPKLSPHGLFIAQARAVDNLPKLFKKQIISVAVASRYNFPTPGPITPRTAQDRFDKRYQVVVATNVGTIPKPE